MVFKAVRDEDVKASQKTPAERIEEPEEREEMKKPHKKKKNSGKKAVIIIAIVLAVLCAAAVAGGFAVQSSAKIFPNVMINGVSVGGLTVDQAKTALDAGDWQTMADENVTVVLPAGCKVTVNASKAGAVQKPEDAANAAYSYGRDGSVFTGLFKYLKCVLAGSDVTADVMNLSESYIRGQISKGVADMNEALSGEAYSVDTEKKVLTMVKGAGSIKVDEDEVYKLITEAIAKGSYEEIEYQYTAGDAGTVDMKAIHDKVCVEAKDASYDSKTGTVTESVTGVEFDVDEAQKLWDDAAAGATVTVPITVTEPKISTDDLSSKLFKDKLGSQTSSFSSSASNRINNIALAAKKIDGVILNPGEEFSYNGTVGQRTEAAGFKKAGAYANGEVVQEVGGGICQVSSTLYCAALYANLKISDRTNHYFPVNYLPSGLDATVSWKSPDFKFVNDRDYPIKISAKCDTSKKTLTIEIWGTDVDGSYVELKYSTWKVYDSKYPTVAIGMKATTYRNLFNSDGTMISSTKEATSTYHYHKENIVYPTPTPTATPAPTPTPVPSAAVEETPPPIISSGD